MFSQGRMTKTETRTLFGLKEFQKNAFRRPKAPIFRRSSHRLIGAFEVMNMCTSGLLFRRPKACLNHMVYQVYLGLGYMVLVKNRNHYLTGVAGTRWSLLSVQK